MSKTYGTVDTVEKDRVVSALTVGYQALKDITNAAESGAEYTADELREVFGRDIKEIRDTLIGLGVTPDGELD